MSFSVDVDPALCDLLTALGLMDADGHVDGAWFSHPLDHLRTVVSDPVQRSALLRLLDTALPPVFHPLAPPGSSWHPLLQDNAFGNVYLTVTGDVLGLALLAGTDPDELPGIQATALLPLVDATTGDLKPVAASPDHPLDLGVVATLPPGAGPDVVGVRVAVDSTGQVRARVRLEDGPAGSRTVAELDPTRLDSEMLDAVVLLLRSVIDAVGDAAGLPDDVAQVLRRVTTHLFGLIGLGDPAITELPVAQVLAGAAAGQPAPLKTWLAGVLADQTSRMAWFTHLAGLLGGAPLDAVDPDVSGTGEPTDPLRATVIRLSDDDDDNAAVELRLSVQNSVLTAGVGLAANAGRGTLSASIGVLAVDLAGTAPVAVLPSADVLLRVPVSADGQDLGTVVAGGSWDGTRVVPVMRLEDVVVGGGAPQTLDLSSAQAVASSATTLVSDALTQAVGEDGVGYHALALLGLVPPLDAAGQPVVGWNHLIGPSLLSGDVLRAVAQMHRAVLADDTHGWDVMLGELAGLLGLDTVVQGHGTPVDPWTVRLVAEAPLTVDLLAWDDAGPTTPSGTRLLRLGLRAAVTEPGWQAWWASELAGFDLPENAAGTPRFLGSQRIVLAATQLPPVGDPAGAWAAVDSLNLSVSWQPGTVPDLRVGVHGLALGWGGADLPPVDLRLPPRPGLDLELPDLGLGIDRDALAALVRALLTSAWRALGADRTTEVVAGLLGLRPDLPGLPSSWPELLPVDSDSLQALLTDPLAALREHLLAVATGTTPDGEPLLSAVAPWLAAVLADVVPDVLNGGPPPSVVRGGSGRHDDPWVVPLHRADPDATTPAARLLAELLVPADAGVSALLWLDPPMPPSQVAPPLPAATTTEQLLDQLAARPRPDPVHDLLAGRPRAWLAAGLDSLAAVLADGDGLVPHGSATAVPGAAWTAQTVACAHDRLPSHHDVLAALATQVAAWGGGGPVVLLSGATGGRQDWDAAVTRLDPGHDPDAALDLRRAAASTLTAVATAYPVDLDDDGTGQVEHLADQVDGVIDRVRTLTGATRVVLVGHGIAGLAARTSAQRRPALVGGVVTLGTPGAIDTEREPGLSSTAAAVTDPALADAVRFAAALLSGADSGSASAASADATTAAGAVDLLTRVLDGGPVRAGVLPPPEAFTAAGLGATVASAFDPAGPDPDAPGPAGAVPGLAIGGQLPDALLAALVAATTSAAVTGSGTTEPPLPTHLGVGLELHAPWPRTTPEEQDALDVELVLRADATRLRLRNGPEPARPRTALTARALVRRPLGWLVGGDGTDPATRGGVRARWAELGLTLAADGGLATTPLVVLHEAAGLGGRATRVDLAALVTALTARGARVPLPAGLAGPAADALLEVLRATGVVVGDDVDTATVEALATTPAFVLAGRVPALLDAMVSHLGAVGAVRAADAGWSLRLATGVTLTVEQDPWTVRLAAAEEAESRVQGSVAVVLPTFATSAECEVVEGPARLAWSSQTRAITASAPPWLPPITFCGNGSSTPAQVSAAVLDALPRALLSGLLAPFLGEMLGTRLAATPLDLLLTQPLRWVEPVDAAAVDSLLRAVNAALGQPTPGASGGLTLPGGLAVHAAGAAGDPVDLRLAGTVDLADGFAIDLDAGLQVTVPASGPPSVAPVGTVGVKLRLPGQWGDLRIDVGTSAAGQLTLAVTPNADDPNPEVIQLLPSFSGLGALAGTAVRLLPQVLQQLVEELTPAGGRPDPPLAAALQVAEALEIYAPDAQGFTEPHRAARLAAMLDPTWWEHLVTDPPSIAQAVAQVLAVLPPPVGSVTAGTGPDSGTVTWKVPLVALAAEEGAISLSLGWTADSRPVVLAEAAGGIRLGPVVLDEAALGLSGDLMTHVVLHLDAGGVLAPVRPALDVAAAVDVTSGTFRFAVSVLPLGPGTAADLRLGLAPELVVDDLAGNGGLALLQAWGIPLAVAVLVEAFDTADVLDTHLWGPPQTTGDGPTARNLLAAAGLITADVAGATPVLPATLPDPAAAALKGLQRAADNLGMTVLDDETGSLTLTLESQTVPGGVRTGVRLRGWVKATTDDLVVTVRFGDAEWLDDSNGGVTVWLVEPGTGGPLPVRPTAALDVVGFGADLSRPDEPLLAGTLALGAVGGLVFASVDFFDATNQPKVTVSTLGAGLSVTDAFVDVSGEDGDSFLRKVMPPELTAPFDLTVVYRDGHLDLEGGDPAAPGRFELALPLDLDVSVIRITELLLALTTGGAPSVEAALSGTAELGPIVAMVHRVGVIAVFGGDRPGLRLRFPDKVGLSIDTSTLTLAGFVAVDEAHGRYVGAVEIALLGKFQLSAVALITTRNPDGTPGFSLLFLISIVFPVPITLGYGFFFAGAGGLLGINRSIDLDRLRNGLRAGTAESILFPIDIVRRADAIVRDLEQVFPVQQGNFLVGPMAMITWSSPPLITLQLGIAIQLGSPFRLAILGLLRAALPDAKEPVLDLKVAFLGAVDVGAKLLSFDASIYDSYIGRGDLKLTLEGDIAVRLCWSDQPDFVASVGGFHPRYSPPTHLHLPALRRVKVSLLKDNPRLSLSVYFAITSNSVQLGARLDFYLGVAGFSVEGEFGFDVLFQFSPFLFDAEVYARLAVRAGGSTLLSIDLDFSLRGPTPWIARGTASFHILFFSVSVEFEKRFGEEQLDTAPLAALLPLLRAELERLDNWQAALPSWLAGAVQVRPPAAGALVVDAGGTLSFSQRVMPFETPITRFGTSVPSDVGYLHLPVLKLAGASDPAPADALQEPFSPGAFTVIADDDKLRAPSFERLASGIQVSTGAHLSTTYTRPRPARYDVIVSDSGDPADEVRAPGDPLPADTFTALSRGGAAGRSAAATNRRVATAAPTLAAGPPVEQYAVVRDDDLRPLGSDGRAVDPVGTDAVGRPTWPDDVLLTRSQADQRLRELGGDPSLHVLPVAQLAAPVLAWRGGDG